MRDILFSLSKWFWSYAFLFLKPKRIDGYGEIFTFRSNFVLWSVFVLEQSYKAHLKRVTMRLFEMLCIRYVLYVTMTYLFRCLHWQKVANVECGVRKEMALYLSHKFLVKTKLFHFQLLKIHFVLGVFLNSTRNSNRWNTFCLFPKSKHISTSLLKKVCVYRDYREDFWYYF